MRACGVCCAGAATVSHCVCHAASLGSSQERFGYWDDLGVNPFVPPGAPKAQTLLRKAASAVGTALLVVLRTPLIVLALPLLLLGAVFDSLLAPVAALQRGLRLATERPGARMLLFALGYWNIRMHTLRAGQVAVRCVVMRRRGCSQGALPGLGQARTPVGLPRPPRAASRGPESTTRSAEETCSSATTSPSWTY